MSSEAYADYYSSPALSLSPRRFFDSLIEIGNDDVL